MRKILFVFVILSLLFLIIKNDSHSFEYDFKYKTIPGSRLVYKDKSVNYDSYFVYDFYSKEYVLTNYSYFNNLDDYYSYFNSVSDDIIDYDESSLMVYSFISEGINNYVDVLNILESDYYNEFEVV